MSLRKKKTLFEYTNKDILVFTSFYKKSGASLIAQLGKNLPAVQETRVRLLGQEDPLEKEMATHSSILAWIIPWTEELGVHGVEKSQTQLKRLSMQQAQ